MSNYLQILISLVLLILVRNEEEQKSVEENSDENVESQSDGFTQENAVFVLNDSNFDEFLKKHPTALVEFYAPWCGHCKQLAPEYEKAAEELAGTIPLAKVDATVEKELAKRFKIVGFPSIFFFKEGQTEPTPFDGDREAEGIVKWLKQKTDPNYKPPPEEVVALTRETFDDFVADKPIMLVEFYAPWCGHCKKLAPEYENAASKLKKHDIPLAKVDATEEKKLAEEYGVQGYPTLKILRNGRRFDYNGPREADGIVNYMLDQAQPAAKKTSITQ